MNAEPTSARVARSVGLLITLLIKLTGLIIAAHEILFRSQIRSGVLAECGFMMAGAQLSEALILAILDRLLAAPPPPPSSPESRPRA